MAQQHGSAHAAHDSALSVPGDKVRELEDEVRGLADRANFASQRFADYENEIRVLRAQLRQAQRKHERGGAVVEGAAATVNPPQNSANNGVAAVKPGISRFGSFMHSQRKVSSLEGGGGGGGGGGQREKELEAALVKEQTARIAAEAKVKEVEAEIEELSASLFQQANEMVAAERRANADLREKVEGLEGVVDECGGDGGGEGKDDGGVRLRRENARLRERVKVLEQRDGERRRRLERLEAAGRRVEKVRGLLVPR